MISIIAPCLNEEGNIISFFQRIQRSLVGIEYELLIIDDGSTDQTYEQAQSLALENPGIVIPIRHEENLGIPSAWETGVLKAKGDYVCLIDSDLQNPPEYIPDLLRAIDENQVHFAQAVRSSIGRVKDQRLILSTGLNRLLNFVFNQSARDSKSGYLVGETKKLRFILANRPVVRHFQTFIGVAIRSYGFRVVEVETLFESRQIGHSFISGKKAVRVSIQVLFDIPAAYFVYRSKKGAPSLSSLQFPRIRLELSFWKRFRFEIFFLTMPLHKWIIGRSAKKYYIWLKSTEFSTKNSIKELQLERFQRLISHAYHHVPYYKRILDEHSIKPNEIKSIDEITKIPLLSKKEVRSNIHFSLFSDNHVKKEMLRINTSGSTGEPFVCYADKFQLEMRFATTLRAAEMSGWKFGDKQLRLWHQTLGMTRSQVLKEKIDAFFLRRKFIPAFEMTQESVNKLIKKIEKFKPTLIDGYAESLNFIASSNFDKISWRPKAIVSSAQQLTEATRSKIENMFGVKVLDKYGSREFSGIAYQCKESNHHHVQEESYIVEILVDGRQANPGEVGEVVITDLNNFSVPLIRYRLGDLALAVAQDPCVCGRPHGLIGEITGRTQALVSCANGVWLPGTFFAHFFKDYDFAIKHYQVFQKVHGAFEVRLVSTPMFNAEVEKRIIHELLQYAGKETLIEVRVVEEIPLVKTGKRTPVISLIKSDFQEIGSKNIFIK
jgi:phenylacetate-CoA ligase